MGVDSLTSAVHVPLTTEISMLIPLPDDHTTTTLKPRPHVAFYPFWAANYNDENAKKKPLNPRPKPNT